MGGLAAMMSDVFSKAERPLLETPLASNTTPDSMPFRACACAFVLPGAAASRPAMKMVWEASRRQPEL